MCVKLVTFIVFCGLLVAVISVPTPLPEVWGPDYDSEPLEQIQEPNNTFSTALVTIASIIEANHKNPNFDLYPTLHSAIMGPFSLISRSIKDMLSFYDQRSIYDILSFSNLKSAVVFLPHRVIQYWSGLIEMEIECMFRTICDISAYVSPRLPYWLNQMVGIYFTSNSDSNMYYRAVANGMINHNCINYYPKCSPKTFFTRLASNMSDIITTTISPLTLRVMNAINS